MQFCFKYKFEIEGKNTINIVFNNLLKNTNFMFSNCSSLTSLNTKDERISEEWKDKKNFSI
jgi:hypothetical protein